MADGHIILDTRVDTTGVTKGFSAIKNGANSVMGAVGKLGAAIGVAFGVSALVKFAKQSVELSSDVQEVQNVVDVAFGDMRDQMEAFANTAIEKFGISRLTAKRTGSTYMAMAKGMGIAGQEAADMALNLTGLSADMASFYNVSQKYTDIALKSVFTGETETLKQYGIVMTQTNLQEFARQKGITKSIQAMTQQEQTMLRYQYVMKQTALAQGDFARTQDSWANQTRILSERWKEMQIVWGDAFRTIGTLILPAVNSLIKGLAKVGEYAKVAAQAIARVFGKEIDSTDQTSDNISEAVSNQEDLAKATEQTTKAAKGQLAAYDEVNQISKDTAETSGGIGGGQPVKTSKIIDTAATETSIDKLANKLKNTFAPVVEYLESTFGGAWEKIKTTGVNSFERIKKSLSLIGSDFAENIAPRIVQTFKNDIIPIFADFTRQAAKSFDNFSEKAHNLFDKMYVDVISPFAQRFVNIWGDMWDKTKEIWGEKSGSIFDNFNEWISNIFDLFNNWWDTLIKPIFDHIGETIDWLWDKHLKGLWDRLQKFIATVTEDFLIIWNKVLYPIYKYIQDTVYPAVKDIVDGIGDIIGTLVGHISDMLKNMMRMLGGLLDFITGVFTGNWDKAWQGIKDMFGGWWNGIYDTFKTVINLVIDGLNALWRAIYRTFSGIANGIGKAVGWIGSLMGKDWEFSMPKYPPTIPKLARGAVLPANKPFLAQLGDQKNGRNLEAPESLLRDIYAEGNAETNSLLQQLIQVMQKGMTVNVDGKQLMRINREAETRVGRQTVTGGFANAY